MKLKVLYSSAILFAVSVFPSFAEIPDGYYSALDGKASSELKSAACTAVTPHTQLRYNQLWNEFRYTDVHPAPDQDQWWDMYSGIKFYVSNGSSGMNREHSFPKSWWGGNQNSAYTDLNHLYPSESAANTAKNNYPLGTVARSTFDNGYSKVGYAVAGQGGGATYVFEPADEYKGDFARTYFYMVTMYQALTWKYTYMLEQNTYPTLRKWAYDMLLEWHRNDPVSQKEIDRNEAVYSRQGNRNPFIDFPDLAEYIWGRKVGEIFHVTSGGDTGDPALTTPMEGTALDFSEVAVNNSQTLNLIIKGSNISAPLKARIYDDGTGDAAYFKAAVTSIPAVAVNSADGYPLPITYSPTAIGNHRCHVVLYGGGLKGSFDFELMGQALPTPSLHTITATAASDVTSTSFTANWEIPADDVIDCYVVTLKSVLNGVETSRDTIAEDNSCHFSGLPSGYKYSYYVQSQRLGYLSQPSNVINVDYNSVTGIETDALLTANGLEGKIIFYTSEPHSDCFIYTPQGTVVMHLQQIENYQVVDLPQGIYIITTRNHHTPIKVLVK